MGGEFIDNFFNLRAEKQEHIINAGLTVFGRNGYKKASIADIAEEAHIAKGMVIYYFGSKKNLYLYLMELCGKIIMDEITKGFDPGVTDFFDKIKMGTNIKMGALKKFPAIFTFFTSAYYETDKEVREEVAEFIKDGMAQRQDWIFGETDVSRFKPDVDPKKLDKFMVWAAEGFSANLQLEGNLDKVESFVEELFDCLDFMKKYFYKEDI